MAGPLDLYNFVQGQAQAGRERGTQSRLGQLYAQAVESPQEARAPILAQMARTGGAGAAVGAQGALASMDKDAAATLARDAGYIVALAESGDKATLQSAYQQFAQRAQQTLGRPVPPEYTDSFLPGLRQLAGAASASGVQSTYVDAQGNRVAIMRDGSTQILGQNDRGMSQQTLSITGPDGRPRQFTFDKRTGGYMPAGAGMAPMGGGMAPAGGGIPPQQMAPGEVPFSIDPTLPPQVQAAIRSDPAAGSAQGISSLSQVGQSASPFVGRSPEQQAALTTAAQEAAKLQFLPQQQAIETQGAIERTRGTEQAKADVERQAGEPARQEKVRQALAKTANITRTIDDAIGRVGATTAGFLGSMTDEVPGTPANDLRVTVNTIKANLAFDALQAMREASPTGGALGAVSERELALLESAVASLDQSQSPEQMRQALQRVKQHYGAWAQAVRQADQEATARARGNGLPPRIDYVNGGNADGGADPLGIL